jgi:hypothetical protein
MGQEMIGWRRYAVVTGGMILAGAVCAPAAGFTVSARGALGPTVLQAERPVAAAFVCILCFGLATGLAALVGRLVNAVVGLFVLGSGLAVLAIRWGSIQDLALGGGALGPMVIETLAWGVLVGVAAFVVFRVAGPVEDFGSGGEGLVQRFGLRAFAVGLAVVPVVWVLARSELKGQTLAAVTGGAMVVGLLARTLSPEAQPRLLFVAPLLFGAVGQFIGLLLVSEPLPEAFVHWTIPPVNFPMPVDYAAGSLMGVAMGLGWARSFQHETAAAGARSTEHPPGRNE